MQPSTTIPHDRDRPPRGAQSAFADANDSSDGDDLPMYSKHKRASPPTGAHATQALCYHEGVDFSNIALYIPAIQLFGTLVVASGCLLLHGWFLQGIGCAVRSAALCGTICVVGLWKKIRMPLTAGADAIFDSLRPAAVVWLVAVVAEHLVGACIPEHDSMRGVHSHDARLDQPKPPSWVWSTVFGETDASVATRNAVYHIAFLIMMLSGLTRSLSPNDETSDRPFGISIVALLVTAIVPPAVPSSDRGRCARPTRASRSPNGLCTPSPRRTSASSTSPPRRYRSSTSRVWRTVAARYGLWLRAPATPRRTVAMCARPLVWHPRQGQAAVALGQLEPHDCF